MANGPIPSQRMYESRRVVAFLDINPIRSGHVQVVSRAHYPYYDDLPPEVANEILAVGQSLALVLRRLFKVPRVAFLFTGGDVAHAHVHVVPMVEPAGITSTQYIVERPLTFQAAPRAEPAELERIAADIRREVALGKPA